MSTSAALRDALAHADEGFESRRLRASIARRMFAPTAPPRLGRYIVGELLGRGGMGTVYSAFDPLLQRRVAIKLLNDDSTGTDTVRLHREAGALAALAHPNVVTVYEVGWCSQGPYVVMELIFGVPLSMWLEQHPESTSRFDSIIELLIQTGRGLVAAHAAGLVHHDVKPSNVLVGRDHDGALRARIADFGLARAHDSEPSQPATDETNPRAASLARGGTPRYMSPEQIDGAAADARSDQFSFCVTAFEALFGASAFAGDTLYRRRLAIERGPTRPPLLDGRRRRIYDVLRIGLAESPDARHRDMAELIVRLEAASKRPRYRLTALLAVLVAGGAGALSLHEAAPPMAVDPCAAEPPGAKWWAHQGQPRLDAAAADLGAPANLLEPIAASVAWYLRNHDEAWHRACATESPAERDVALACLSQQRAELEQVFAAIVVDERALRQQGAASIEALADPTRCDEAVRSGSAEPYDAVHRDIATELTSAELAIRRGDFDEGRSHADAARAHAASARRPRLQARAELVLGTVDRDAGRWTAAAQWLARAHATATAAGDDGLAGRVALMLVRIERGAETRAAWFRHGESAMARLGRDASLEAMYWSARGFEANLLTDSEQSIEHHHRALDIKRSILGGDRLAVVEDLMGISMGLSRLARHDEALEWAHEAERIAIELLGPAHPTMLTIRAWRGLMANDVGLPAELAAIEHEMRAAVGTDGHHYLLLQLNIGVHESKNGELDKARMRMQRALDDAQGAETEAANAIADLHYQLGWVAQRQAQPDVARREFSTAIEVAERMDPGGKAAVAAQIALAELAARDRDWPLATATLRDALTRLDDSRTDPRYANALAKLAATLFDSGDIEAARPMIADAQPAVASTFGEGSQRMAELLQLRGDLEQADGDRTAAIATYAEAERIMLALERKQWANIGYGRLRQAELHWAAGDRTTARLFATMGIAAYEQAPHGAAGIAEGRAWLAAHPLGRR